MSRKNKVIVIQESETGRNIRFLDTKTKQEMTRLQFVKKIENKQYPNYSTRVINGLKTPVSKPNNSEKDNLG